MATVTTTLSCRKRASPSLASASSNKKRKLTELFPDQQPNTTLTVPLDSLSITGPDCNEPLLNRELATFAPDLRRQVTCLILFLLVVARMSNATPSPSHYKEASPHSQHELRTARAQKRPQLGYVKTTKVLNKLDVLSTTAQAILTKIDGLTETVAEIDWIMETETPQLSSTVARLKETCQELIEGYQESLAILDQQQV